MKTINVSVNFGRGQMKATISKFEARNWTYVNFAGGGRMCLDNDGNIVKAQSHRMPVVDEAERKRIISEVS